MTDDIVVIGSATLDLLRESGRDEVTVRFGGVCLNAACLLSAMGFRVRFVTANYEGDAGIAVASYLKACSVEWSALADRARLPVYTAVLDSSGEISDEDFLNPQALDQLTPEVVESVVREQPGAILTCTDLSSESLEVLRGADPTTSCWLLSSSLEEVHKLKVQRDIMAGICLNRDELRELTGLSDPSALLGPSETFVRPGGQVLVTAGHEGAYLVSEADNTVWLQSTDRQIGGVGTIGAGDVCFAAWLGSMLQGKDGPQALRRSVEVASAFIGLGAGLGPERYRDAVNSQSFLLSDPVQI